MINAKQALELYDQSEAEVEHFLTYNVEKTVTYAAKDGKRSAFVLLGTAGPFDYVESQLTPLNRAVARKLRDLGYRTSFTLDGDKYIPPGLADEDGKGPLHQNYGIKIEW